MYDILITIFFILMIFNSFLIITSKNSVHSVLFLVLNFIITTGILLILEREFLALSFLIIYVGAISILFLFVIMMLDIKVVNSTKDLLKYFPVGSLIGIIFFLEIFYIIFNTFIKNSYSTGFYSNSYTNWFKSIDYVIDITALGQIIYTHFVIQFLLAGIILLLSVIASIILTRDSIKIKPRKQILFRQISRQYKNIILT